MSRDAEGRSVVDVTLADSVAEFSKYSGWPELKESFMAGQVRAAYLLAPMVMDLVDSGVAAKIVSLGHRSGAVIMVRTDSPVKSIKDLRGRRIAIPSRFAVDHLFVRRMLRENGMTVRDVELVEMAPPEMPAGRFQYACSLHAAGTLTLLVDAEPGPGLKRLRWRLDQITARP
jgi:NitT/TauT family transport system substrate-binding protein